MTRRGSKIFIPSAAVSARVQTREPLALERDQKCSSLKKKEKQLIAYTKLQMNPPCLHLLRLYWNADFFYVFYKEINRRLARRNLFSVSGFAYGVGTRSKLHTRRYVENVNFSVDARLPDPYF